MAADVETVRRIYAALAAGDVGPLVDLMAEDIEWHEPYGAPVVAGVYHGRASVLSDVLLKMTDVWAQFRVEPQEFHAAGDTVTVLGELSVMGRGPGGRAVVPFAHIWEFRDGVIGRWRSFTDTALLQRARTSR